MIVLIGNKGSFSKECFEYLSKYFRIYLLHVDDLDFSSLNSLSNSLHELINCRISKIVYIGGETKNDSIMYMNNCEIPILLSKFCFTNKLQFILLGSLSQWGFIDWKPKTDIYDYTPVRIPYDEYSRTKQMCFISIKESKDLCGYFICPASILNHKHRSGSLYMYENFLKYRFVECLFQFRGLISYCERVDVYAAIVKAILSDELNGNVIVSKSIPASNISTSGVNRFKINFTYFTGITFFYLFKVLGFRKISQKVTLLFTEVNFISNSI